MHHSDDLQYWNNETQTCWNKRLNDSASVCLLHFTVKHVLRFCEVKNNTTPHQCLTKSSSNVFLDQQSIGNWDNRKS